MQNQSGTMLSRQPQQNGSSMPQMQNPSIRGAKNDYVRERMYMQRKRIFQFLMKHLQNPHGLPSKQLIIIVKHLERSLFKNCTSMDEYFNLATLDSRLRLLIKDLQTNNRKKQFSQANSSPAVATIVPIPGLQQTANSSLSMSSTIAPSCVNSEIFMPNGFEHSSSAFSVNTGSSQIAMPGFYNSNNNDVNIHLLVDSESTSNVGGLLAVESSVASQPMQQNHQVGHQNSQILHNFSGHMGGGIRSALHQKSYGLSNGPLKGGLDMMGNNTGQSQQQFNQNQQPLFHGDGGAAYTSENIYVPVTSAGSVTNQNLNSMYLQSMENANTPLMMRNHSNVHYTQLMTNLDPQSVDQSEKMNFQSQHSLRNNFENHQVRQLQQPSDHQFQHQLQHQLQQEQLTHSRFLLKNDDFGQSQISHNLISCSRAGHPTEHYDGGLLLQSQVNDVLQFSDMPNQFHQNSIEDRSRATQFVNGHVSSSMRQTSDQMEVEKLLYQQQSVVSQETSHVYNRRPSGQSEARLNNLPVEESGIIQTGPSKSVGPLSGSNKFSQPHNTDRERQYKNQQRWLLFLRHARRCSAPKGKCPERNCLNVQGLLKHMENCNVPECPEPQCRSTRFLIEHHRKCHDVKCPVCIPVKNYIQKHLKAAVLSDCSPRLLSYADASCTSHKTVNISRKSTPKANPVIAETLGDLQPPMKRMKIEQGLQSVDKKCETSVPLLFPANDFHIPKKADVAEVKVEDPGSVGQLISENIEMIRDFLGKADMKVPEKNHAVSKDHAGFVVQEIDRREKEMVQSKSEKALEPQEVGSKSGKPKIMGVSLTELFTPEQIRQHITGLRQWVGQSKVKAEKNQAREHSMTENSCQLCAAENLTFEPPPIYCTPCGARVKKNGPYHTVAANDTRHYVCTQCYNGVRGDTILVDGITTPKAKMVKTKNHEETCEPWVQCDKCKAWQHQICALFNNRRNEGEQTEYTCPNCYIQELEKGERSPLPHSAVLGAKDLPRTILSDHLEQRLFAKLKHERQERAKLQGKSYDEVPGAESLVVRVVSSVDKKVEVKSRFLEIFKEENYPAEFPYKSKVILVFQNIEGVEVCLFGMYVQEFGSECQQPNTRRVYLSYLDSVKYFRPDVKTITGEALRTFVYHEILIGYLGYCKMRGFTSCYIWACPPLKGEDYILYCHPEIQKTPKSDKLREWYLSMLRKALRENIAVNLTNLYDHFFVSMGECKAKVTAARLPYFDGDYWPGAAEDMIYQLQQEGDERKHHKKGTIKKTITKRSLQASGQIDLSGNVSKDMLLMHKLGQTILPMKEDFIMVHLQHACTHCCTLMVSGNRWVCKRCQNFQLCDKCYDAERKREDRERHPIDQKDKHPLYPIEVTDVPEDTRDKDEIVESEFFDTRQAFLSLCQGNHYQYDTLRRAKHSSMMVLYHLHNPTAPAFVATCNSCRLDIESGQGWRCNTCPDYDLCNSCYLKDGGTGHPHKLTNNPSSNAQNRETRQLRIKQLRKTLDLLVHAHICRSLQCQYPNCRKVKGLFHHGTVCKVRVAGNCALCKKMWQLIQLHARACKESQCDVPRCKDLRMHMRRSQQQSESRRRAAFNEMMRLRADEVEVATSS